jgi:hypothetical protein
VVALSMALVTLVAQGTVKLLTDVASPVGEVLRSVWLGLVLVGMLVFWQTSFNAHFHGASPVSLGLGFLIAYAAGFMFVMGIDLIRACVLAVVTAGLSVGLVLVFKPLF